MVLCNRNINKIPFYMTYSLLNCLIDHFYQCKSFNLRPVIPKENEWRHILEEKCPFISWLEINNILCALLWNLNDVFNIFYLFNSYFEFIKCCCKKIIFMNHKVHFQLNYFSYGLSFPSQLPFGRLWIDCRRNRWRWPHRNR